MKPKKHIAIVGGGWAGLAAAVTLCQKDFQVSLFESSPQLGGRARSIQSNGVTLDNGQHLMIGAYQQMLDLLKRMQVDIDTLFEQIPHRMLMLDSQTGDTAFDLNLPTYPAPLHLLFGVLNTPSLTLTEKFSLLWRFNKLLNTPIKSDISVSQWLENAQLPRAYIENLLLPVCLAALTTHPQQASAKAFQSVLQQTFTGTASFTDLLIPKADLSQIFPNIASAFILQNSAQIYLKSKVQQLHVEDKRITGLQINDSIQHFDHIILATPASVSAKLLAPISVCAPLCEQIRQLKHEPVSTLYLHFAANVNLPYPMVGLLNGYGEWVFERRLSGNENILAVVISAQGQHSKLPTDELVNTIYEELARVFGTLPALIHSQLITEKRAAFQCHVGVDTYRPAINTNLINLNLCGDYVYIEENNSPGLPSTLEGALRSGVKCAQILISTETQH